MKRMVSKEMVAWGEWNGTGHYFLLDKPLKDGLYLIKAVSLEFGDSYVSLIYKKEDHSFSTKMPDGNNLELNAYFLIAQQAADKVVCSAEFMFEDGDYIEIWEVN